MANLNPIQLLQMMKQGNPQQIVEMYIQQNYANNPQMQSILEMGRKGDTIGLQNYAKQFLSSRGVDYDKEMANLMNLFK